MIPIKPKGRAMGRQAIAGAIITFPSMTLKLNSFAHYNIACRMQVFLPPCQQQETSVDSAATAAAE